MGDLFHDYSYLRHPSMRVYVAGHAGLHFLLQSRKAASNSVLAVETHVESSHCLVPLE